MFDHCLPPYPFSCHCFYKCLPKTKTKICKKVSACFGKDLFNMNIKYYFFHKWEVYTHEGRE
jgi:hypothetical protein